MLGLIRRNVKKRPNNSKYSSWNAAIFMPIIRHGNKTHTRGYPPELNPNWRIFSILIGFEYGFSLISKHGYGTGNGYVDTHPGPIPKPVPNVKNYFILICYVILFDNCHVNKNYHWYLKDQLNHWV